MPKGQSLVVKKVELPIVSRINPVCRGFIGESFKELFFYCSDVDGGVLLELGYFYFYLGVLKVLDQVRSNCAQRLVIDRCWCGACLGEYIPDMSYSVR